jgi:hypothetical protein
MRTGEARKNAHAHDGGEGSFARSYLLSQARVDTTAGVV